MYGKSLVYIRKDCMVTHSDNPIHYTYIDWNHYDGQKVSSRWTSAMVDVSNSRGEQSVGVVVKLNSHERLRSVRFATYHHKILLLQQKYTNNQ